MFVLLVVSKIKLASDSVRAVVSEFSGFNEAPSDDAVPHQAEAAYVKGVQVII